MVVDFEAVEEQGALPPRRARPLPAQKKKKKTPLTHRKEKKGGTPAHALAARAGSESA